MKRHAVVYSICFLAAAASLPVTAGDAKEDAVKKALADLKGTWTIVSATKDGKKLTEEQLKGVTLAYDGAGRVTVKQGDKVRFEGTIKIDPTRTPKTLDATQTAEGDNKGKTSLGIYELKGDTLTLCSVEPTAKERPTEFASKPGSGHFLRVYQREQK